jgi:hypothetical protein
MPVSRFFCLVLVVLTVLSSWGCDDDPTSPSPIGTPPALNLSGTWIGPFGPPQSNVSFRATWTASQSGAAVAGNVEMFRGEDNVTFTGRLTGVLSGTRLSLTYTVPRGNVPSAPDCTMSGTGTIDATATLLSGTINVTSTSCEAISVLPSSADSISLVKQ